MPAHRGGDSRNVDPRPNGGASLAGAVDGNAGGSDPQRGGTATVRVKGTADQSNARAAGAVPRWRRFASRISLFRTQYRRNRHRSCADRAAARRGAEHRSLRSQGRPRSQSTGYRHQGRSRSRIHPMPERVLVQAPLTLLSVTRRTLAAPQQGPSTRWCPPRHSDLCGSGTQARAAHRNRASW
jgi:hypothetical protein